MARRKIDYPYEPRPEIARLKSFNNREGFNCYHVEWDIGKLPVTSRESSISADYFKTNYRGDQEWMIRFFVITKGCGRTRVNIVRNYNSDDDEEVPVIIRVKLMNRSKGICEFAPSASFLLSDIDWSFDWAIPDEVETKLSKTDHYVVHCWMDIPKKYDGRCNYVQNSGPVFLSSALARSFDKITIKDGDPTSDIELVIKDGSEDPPRFYCHRLILIARSPVFETMVTNDRFKESNERIVEIEDMDEYTLNLVLKYLYTGQVVEKYQNHGMSKELINSLLNAAEKYMLPELKDECVLALIGSGTAPCDDGEWIEYLQLAETFNLEYLRKVCVLALSTNMSSLREQNIRDKVSSVAMMELLDMVTKRGEITTTLELKTGP